MKRRHISRKEIVFLVLLAIGFAFTLVACDPPTTTVTGQPTTTAGVLPSGTAQAAPQQAVAVPGADIPMIEKPAANSGESAPLVYSKYEPGIKQNVSVALGVNNGALRKFKVDVGQKWSFGATLGDVNTLPFVMANGVNGGGLGDLAARYVLAWKSIGLVPVYQPSQRQMADVPQESAPLIWLGDPAGNADLVLVNNSQRAVVLEVVETGEQLTVKATVLQSKG